VEIKCKVNEVLAAITQMVPIPRVRSKLWLKKKEPIVIMAPKTKKDIDIK
jgi:hypothetical protein